MSTDINAFAGFLDVVDFDYFATFTTRKPTTLSGARLIAERLCKFLNAGSDTSIFWAAEPFDTGADQRDYLYHPGVIDPTTGQIEKARAGRLGYHFHALIKTPYHQIEIFNWYFERYGRCQIIVNKDPAIKRAASYYLTKYVTKNCSDYDFHFSADIKGRNQANLF